MNKIEQALLNADDLAISEEVDCSDVLWYIGELNKEKEQVRKDTAKEILQDLYNQANSTVWEAIEWTTDDIKEYAKKYGVEVEE